MPSAYLQWQFHSGEQVVAHGPLVVNSLPEFSDFVIYGVHQLLPNFNFCLCWAVFVVLVKYMT